jgi:hypothetical protein
VNAFLDVLPTILKVLSIHRLFILNHGVSSTLYLTAVTLPFYTLVYEEKEHGQQ